MAKKATKKTTKKAAAAKPAAAPMEKEQCSCACWALATNRWLLALLFFVPGVMKLLGVFGVGPVDAQAMLVSLGFPIAAVFTWVLILAELAIGISFAFKCHMRCTSWLGAIVMIVAAVTVQGYAGGWNPVGILTHLTIAANLIAVAKLIEE